MDAGYNLRRIGIDKIAMFGLLVLAIFCAAIVISQKKSFSYSEPIALEAMGLSVSMPEGNQWQSSHSGWQYRASAFILKAVLPISSNEAVMVNWHYSLAPQERDIELIFEKKAKYIQGRVVGTTTKQINNLPIESAQILSKKNRTLLHTAIIDFDTGHLLTLEVAQTGGPLGLAGDIFEALVKELRYNAQNPLKKGVEFVSKFKNARLAYQKNADEPVRYYRLKDTSGNTAGFVAEGFVEKVGSQTERPLVAASLYYLKDRSEVFSGQSIFSADYRLKTYKWVTRSNYQATTIALDANGVMSSAFSSAKIIRKTLPGPAAIPEIFLDLLVRRFAQERLDKIAVEVILSNSLVKSAMLTRLPQATDPHTKKSAAYVIGVDFLDNRGSCQEYYLDARGGILSTHVIDDFNYIIVPASRQQVYSEFENLKESIVQIEEYLKID